MNSPQDDETSGPVKEQPPHLEIDVTDALPPPPYTPRLYISFPGCFISY